MVTRSGTLTSDRSLLARATFKGAASEVPLRVTDPRVHAQAFSSTALGDTDTVRAGWTNVALGTSRASSASTRNGRLHRRLADCFIEGTFQSEVEGTNRAIHQT